MPFKSCIAAPQCIQRVSSLTPPATCCCIAGPKAGTIDDLVGPLPGVPDGISRAPDGSFWVSLVAPVKPISALLQSSAVRAALAWLPPSLRPSGGAWGAVVKVSQDGVVLDFLTDPTGKHVSDVSAAKQGSDGWLYLGNLAGDYVSRVRLKP